MSVLRAGEALPAHLAPIADRLRAVTVEIECSGGSGAGLLWASDLIVTNAHVVRTSCVRVWVDDHRHVEAGLVAADRRADLAVLRIPPSGIAPPEVADADDVRVGAIVVALGHPLGLRRTLTAGVVHAVAPLVRGGRRWIHADVRLAPGNSGGPLADAAGRVIGVNTMIAGGLALAIPIDEVSRFAAAAVPSAP